MFNITRGLLIALSAAACSGGNKYISESDFENYEYVDTADTGIADTADTEETDTQDTDTQETDIPEICKNDYHPIHQTGWKKTFTATYEGSTAIATEEGIGEVTWNGQQVYAYKDTMTATEPVLGGLSTIETGWNTTIYVACNYQGQEGMFMLAWEGNAKQKNLLGFPTAYDVSATLSPYRRYLSPEYAVGAEGSWNYDYNLSINAVENNCSDGQDNDFDFQADAADPDCQNSTSESGNASPQNQSTQVTGSYLDAGFQNITILAGTSQAQTVMAYKVINTVTQTEALGQTTESYIEQYWVKGLGMVKEDFIDSTGAITLSKELSGLQGLTVIQ